MDSNQKGSGFKINKPRKYKLKELLKKRVILTADIPKKSKDMCRIEISMYDEGIIEFEAKVAGLSVSKKQLEFVHLLENQKQTMEIIDQLTFCVDETIKLINKHFM